MPTQPLRAARTTVRPLQAALDDVLSSLRQNACWLPSRLSRIRIALASPTGERLELELEGDSGPPPQAARDCDPAHLAHSDLGGRALEDFKGIDELDLGASAKAAAQKLLKAFPNDVKFTSGRRSIAEQGAAMAPNVLRNRKWIEQTYKDTPQRADLQNWVDDHPEAKTASTVAAGLEGVMNGWTEAQKRTFSRHITGDAFDVQPVAGATGDKIKSAITMLPKLDWSTFNEGGLEIWHAQFDA